MKVAYIGKVQLSDVDLSYVHHAQQLADVTFILEITPRYLRGPAITIREIYPKSGLFKAVDVYPEFRKYMHLVDIDRFYVLNTCGRLWMLKAFLTNLKLLRFLKRERFRVIHWAWPPNVYEFCTYSLRKRMLLTVHDPFPHTGHDSFVVRLRRKAAFRFIPRLILLNRTQRNDFIRHYRIDPSRIIDSRLGPYIYLKTVKPDIDAIPDGRYILFAGRISPYKGLDYLLPAMKKVHEVCPNCKLLVAGTGKFHFDITEYQALDYIEFRNRFIPDEEMVAIVQAADFMVCPYTDATQSGVIMTAFTFNVPVIATNVGALPEMVRHNHYGLIVKEKDSDALAEAVITLWKDVDRTATYGKEIENNYVNGNLSWKHIAFVLHDEYSKIR